MLLCQLKNVIAFFFFFYIARLEQQLMKVVKAHTRPCFTMTTDITRAGRHIVTGGKVRQCMAGMGMGANQGCLLD